MASLHINMKFKFNYRNEKREIDVKIRDSVFSKARGLMFRRKSKPLLFIFNKPTRQPIHSFFCKPFYAIWFDGDKIIDERLVEGWRIGIKPRGSAKFDRLLEIPTEIDDFMFLRERFK